MKWRMKWICFSKQLSDQSSTFDWLIPSSLTASACPLFNRVGYSDIFLLCCVQVESPLPRSPPHYPSFLGALLLGGTPLYRGPGLAFSSCVGFCKSIADNDADFRSQGSLQDESHCLAGQESGLEKGEILDATKLGVKVNGRGKEFTPGQ